MAATNSLIYQAKIEPPTDYTTTYQTNKFTFVSYAHITYIPSRSHPKIKSERFVHLVFFGSQHYYRKANNHALVDCYHTNCTCAEVAILVLCCVYIRIRSSHDECKIAIERICIYIKTSVR
jgi:hypothetical protein